MAGWNKRKVAAFKAAFADFLQYAVIDSKETGEGPLVLYGAQKRFLTELFDGLENDIHFFVVLKARQLGMSTIVRFLIIFWAFMHKGLRVALVYDTDKNKMEARAEIALLLERLPKSHRIPTKRHSKEFLELENGSRVSYLVAGIKKSKGSGGLGRSLGINVAGCTEMSSWADVEGLRAFERSLAQTFENRLYIWESTARGFNIFYDIWKEAVSDDLAKRAIFIGWWAKEIYSIPQSSPLFDRYGIAEPTEEEQKKIDIVKERYGHTVTMEQLAWYRHEYDPDRGGEDREHIGQDIIQQELPWYEEEAFLMSGSQFFPTEKLTEAAKKALARQPKGYSYYMSDDFFGTVIEPTRNARKATLKIWEEPDPGGVYTIGADPAFGSSETADRYCAQVLRCYADGLDQVAEYCTPLGATYQFAWVIAHLCGAYGNARLLLELNGPGHAVFGEFRTLENLVRTGYLKPTALEKGFTNIFDNVHHYLWARQDTLSRNPTAFHWETTTKRKVMVMERLRDFFHVGQINIRSVECLDEMSTVVRNGDSIQGDGNHKDDRVMALALAVRAWEDSERKGLISQQRTRANEARRATLTQQDMQQIFSQNLVGNFFAERERARVAERRRARRGNRWNW